MIQIYGSPKSSANRCYWTLEEVGAPYERVSISFKDREHKSEKFLKLNPNGAVPVMVDGDFALWESIAIDRYLAAEHQPALLGADARERALVHQWGVWSQVSFQAPVIALFIQLVFVPEARRDQELIAKSRTKTEPLLALLEAHLQARQFMVGAAFTLADLHVASVAKLLAGLGFELTEQPSLAAWLARCLARPAAQRVAAISP